MGSSPIAVTYHYPVITGYFEMLNLVISHKKCLILNINKEPNFVLTFFLKFTLCPNFIAKFVQKSDTFITQ